MTQRRTEFYIQKENRAILNLAVKCRFITVDQERVIIAKLASNDSDQEPSVITFLKELDRITKDEIGFLVSVKKHLKNKFLDIRFGKIAVVNQFTTPEVINRALEKQITHFRKTRKHLEIGDLLVKDKQLSEAEKTAILLTQDRIADEFLEQAINQLASDELERIAICKRFGSIAVKEGYVSIETVNQALKIQQKEKNKGITARFLGQILEEEYNLSHDDTLKILKKQKIYEKKRLNLEKALGKFISRVKINQTISRHYECDISKDKLKAFVRVTSIPSVEIHAPDMINWLNLMGIRFGIIDDNEMEQFLQEGMEGSVLEVAEGFPPQKGEDAQVKFFFDHETGKTPDGDIKRMVQTVKKGTVLAERKPHKEGKPGKNVFGQTLFPPEPETRELQCGKGVYSKDNCVFVAKHDGSPVLYNDRTLFVTSRSDPQKTFEISDDITHKTKNAYGMMNLKITCEIHKGADIKCQNLDLTGNVFGCIDAAGDIDVKGKVASINPSLGPDEEGPVIRAQGAIHVSQSVENAKIISGRVFSSPNADIVSSEICAQCGIYCKNVISNGSRPSILKFGMTTNHRLLEIESAIKKRGSILSLLKKSRSWKQLIKNYFTRFRCRIITGKDSGYCRI